MTRILHRVAMLLFVVAIASCVKDKDVFLDYYSIDSFFDTNLSSFQTFEFDAEKDFSLQVSDFVIDIPQGSIIDSNGDEVSGIVKARYRLLNSPGDYISHRLTTMSNNSLLDPEAIIYLELQQNSNQLSLSNEEDARITIHMPKVTNGSSPNLYGLTDNGWADIDLEDNQPISVVNYTVIRDGLEKQITGYQVSLKSIGWTAIANELGVSDGSYTICAQLPEDHDGINTVVFGTLDMNRSVVGMSYNSEKLLFCGTFTGVISDQSATIISISDQGLEGKFNFGINSAILNRDKEIVASLMPLSRSQIDLELEEL